MSRFTSVRIADHAVCSICPSYECASDQNTWQQMIAAGAVLPPRDGRQHDVGASVHQFQGLTIRDEGMTTSSGSSNAVDALTDRATAKVKATAPPLIPVPHTSDDRTSEVHVEGDPSADIAQVASPGFGFTPCEGGGPPTNIDRSTLRMLLSHFRQGGAHTPWVDPVPVLIPVEWLKLNTVSREVPEHCLRQKCDEEEQEDDLNELPELVDDVYFDDDDEGKYPSLLFTHVKDALPTTNTDNIGDDDILTNALFAEAQSG